MWCLAILCNGLPSGARFTMNGLRVLVCLLGLWTCASSNQEVEDYLDPEIAPPEYFDLADQTPVKLNESYCVEEISATVSNNFSGSHKSLFYVKIMWDSKHFMTSIKLESDSGSDPYCEAQNKHYYVRKPLNQTVHVFPDDVNEGVRFLPIKLDCKYVITPELEGVCRSFKLRYTTPVCIDNDTCTCRNVFFPGPDLEAEMDENGVAVTWSFPENFEQTVSHIILSLYSEEDGINAEKLTKARVALAEVYEANKKKLRQLLRANVTIGNVYRVQGYFENNVNCRGNSTFLLLKYSEKPKKLQSVISYVMSLAFLLLFFLACFMIFSKKELKKICLKLVKEPGDADNVHYYSDASGRKFLLPQMTSNPTYLEPAYTDQSRDSYLFDFRDMVILKEIASGNFGIVYLAYSATGLKGRNEFAIKQIKDEAGPEGLSDFMEEIEIFRQVGDHSNVVKMLGYCSSPQPLTIIMEYVPFNLLTYLKNLRAEFEKKKSEDGDAPVSYAKLSHSRTTMSETSYISVNNVETVPLSSESLFGSKEPNYVLDNRELEVFALQIARGMAHLESRNIVHRDLAARNILMDYSKVLKISDFGMSRTGIYVNKRTRKFPLRWMSPEALVDRVYSNKSDVWSFGVVLWEIGTLGAFPYPSLQNDEVISLLQKGGHLDRPENVTVHLYDVMVRCWARDPDERPTFRNLVADIECFYSKMSGYVEFDNLTPNYVFPPMEEDIERETETGKGDLAFS